MRRKLSIEEKKSRLATKIEKWMAKNKNIHLSFGELLDKFAHTGESCDVVAERFKQMTKNQIKIIHSTFGNVVRLTIKQGKTKFQIKAKIAGNPFRKPGSGIKEKKPKDVVKYTCTLCNYKWERNIELHENQNLHLLSQKCTKCGILGVANAEFLFQNQIYYKHVIENNGIKKECFYTPKKEMEEIK